MLSWNLADMNRIVFVDMGNFYVPFSFDSLDILWVQEEIWLQIFCRNILKELPP